jgi:hypothetical protein
MARRTNLARPFKVFLAYGAAAGVCLIGTGIVLRAMVGLV